MQQSHIQSRATSLAHSGLLVVLLSSVFVGPMLWFHRDSLRNLISFHGTLHVAIAQQFSQGQFPPENPFYAGEPVGYYWFFHYISYLLANVLQTDLLHAIELLSLIALVGLVIIAVALGRRLWGTATAGACLGYLVLVGANGFGWLILLAKIIRDGPQIMGAPATAVIRPLLLQVQFGDHRFGPNFTYYFHMTSRPVALTLTLAMVACLYWLLLRRSVIAGLSLSVVTALCVAFNPLIGLAAGGALVGGLIINMAIKPYVSKKSLIGYETSNTTLASCGAIAFGAACAWPTFSHLLFGGSSAGIHFAPFRWKLYGIVVANVFVIAILAGVGYRHLSTRWLGLGRITIIAGVILMLATVLFAMPGTLGETGRTGNEHNLFNTAMVLLAVPASGAVMRSRSCNHIDSRSTLVTWRGVALVLFFVPTTLLIMYSYHGRAPVAVALDRTNMRWLDQSLPIAKYYEWVNTETQADAVFVVSPDQAPQRLCNVSDFPAFTKRTLFTDQRSYMTDTYADAPYRTELSKNVALGKAMTLEDRDYLRNLARPVYLTSYEADNTQRLEALRRTYGKPLFVVDHIATFLLMP